MFAVRVCVVCAVSAVALSPGAVSLTLSAQLGKCPHGHCAGPPQSAQPQPCGPHGPRGTGAAAGARERESGAEVSNYTVRGLIRVIYRERCTGPYTALQYTPHHNISARRAAVPRQLSVLRVDELHAPQQHLQPGAVAP